MGGRWSPVSKPSHWPECNITCYTYTFPQILIEVSTCIVSILQMRSLRLRVVKLLVYSHTAGLNTSPLSHTLFPHARNHCQPLSQGDDKKKKDTPRTPLAVQWLRIHASIAGGAGSIFGWGTEILHAAQYDQKIKIKKKDLPKVYFKLSTHMT